MASQDWLDKDFYAILGVSSDADAATIKKTYRKLARKLHPDQNAGDTAAEAKFKEIGEAYSVLSDPEQRQQYDQLRAMTRGGARFTAGGGGSAGGFEDIFSGMFSGGNTRTRYSTSNSSANDPDMQDLLASLFGQAGGSYPGGSTYGGYDTFGAPRGPRKGADVQARTNLSFRDAVAGQTVTLEAADGQRITTRIPPGVRDGQKIRLRGKGARGDAGAEPGDLILTVTVEKHPVFGRDGDNLTVDLPVTFPEAALGATVSVPTLDGSPVRVKIAPGTPSGRVLRVKGRGVKRGDKSGDLLAKVQVVVPQRLTDAGREALEAMQADEAGQDPRAELFERARA
ncbi:MAG TPA: DnaJ C-terminal domain-containing protein [Lapillicoccus sp.]|jgi:molecular chaperone DnaJ|uniref:DnaJ C-terminal domain-containing protein n=1 Tax=Lapillicoccus sp. TaxID=1909287 RepID=UPI002F926ED1